MAGDTQSSDTKSAKWLAPGRSQLIKGNLYQDDTQVVLEDDQDKIPEHLNLKLQNEWTRLQQERSRLEDVGTVQLWLNPTVKRRISMYKTLAKVLNTDTRISARKGRESQRMSRKRTDGSISGDSNSSSSTVVDLDTKSLYKLDDDTGSIETIEEARCLVIPEEVDLFRDTDSVIIACLFGSET